MAKGQSFTRHQQGIINRYYEHLDTITLGKLGELVSDLYLCETQKKRDQLWGRVETALGKTAMSEARTRTILEKRDIEGLARMVSELQSGS